MDVAYKVRDEFQRVSPILLYGRASEDVFIMDQGLDDVAVFFNWRRQVICPFFVITVMKGSGKLPFCIRTNAIGPIANRSERFTGTEEACDLLAGFGAQEFVSDLADSGVANGPPGEAGAFEN